ncbi:MAG TPA: NAD(P)-dependent oxidoreductase [Beijerinckiaceae bacterium]|nr:NAD(P)-dependent oxidoreductase [Beijerinckiaceae bacterium]
MKVFLSHPPEGLAYYGERPRAELARVAEVVRNPTGRVLEPDELAEAAAGCAVIVADRQTTAPASLFERSPDLVAFVRGAVDIRTVDVEAASRAGVLVTRASPSFGPSVAELALGFMVDLARGITDYAQAYRTGEPPAAQMGRQLKESTLGIIGYGVIGRELARIGLALGMTVLVDDPHKRIEDEGVRQVSLDELLREADFVVCLAVATAETENLMGADQFARMKPTAFFVNLSRGNLVDEDALAAALDAKRIAGAAMDVGRAPDQMPSPALARRTDVIATPHIGGLTPGATERQALDTVEQVRAIAQGRVPQGAVNADKATRLARLKGGPT